MTAGSGGEPVAVEAARFSDTPSLAVFRCRGKKMSQKTQENHLQMTFEKAIFTGLEGTARHLGFLIVPHHISEAKPRKFTEI